MSELGQVAKALLCATQSRHVVIGVFCPRRLAVLEAEVASKPDSRDDGPRRAMSEVLKTMCQPDSRPDLHDRAIRGPDADEDGDIAWLTSAHCMIGLRHSSTRHTPFVGLVGPAEHCRFERWQRDVARIGLLYESGYLRWTRSTVPAQLAGATLDGIMQQLGVACALVDAARNLVYVNDAGMRWLEEQEQVRIHNGRLEAVGAVMQRRLNAAVQSATQGTPRLAQSVVLRPSGEGELPEVVTCLPLVGPEMYALVVFGQTLRHVEVAEVLLNAFGLTPAERRLAWQLLAGRSLEEAAANLNIRISTARSYLKSIFAKTGARRQTEFVAVFGALVPPIAVQVRALPGSGKLPAT